jgi:uncharacterized surface protein with fasciclin (FAS1) repeats
MKNLIQLFLLSLITLNSYATIHQVNAGGVDLIYTPNSLTISLGDTVIWINEGGFHDVNANTNTVTNESFNNPVSFNSQPTQTVGATIYTHVFNIAGTYNYDCSVGNHALEGMTGTIIVEGETNTVMDMIANSAIHSTLETALDTADLVETLSGDGPFTVFAPTDEAFEALPEGALQGLLDDMPALTAVLLHHVHSGNVLSTDLSDGMEVPTLNGDTLMVTIDAGTVMIDMATVTEADIIGSNGVVHFIDMVLLPSTDEETVMSIISNSPIHTMLEEAIIAADDLAETLSGDGPFTVFAPIDDAFDSLPDGILENLLDNTELLSNLLLGHVSDEEVYAEDLEDGMMITVLNDNELTVSIDGMTVMIDMATVTEADIIGSNGVVHMIDMVLLPEVGDVDTTVWSLIEASPLHNTLETALLAADLDETLSGDGPFTVFAPTDEAFEALPEGALQGLLDDIPALTAVLLHHVHSGNVLSTDLSDGMGVPTLNDDMLMVTIDAGTVMIDMATVTLADMQADNGVVHVVNMVLLPSSDPTAIESFLNNKDVTYLYTINLLGEMVDKNSADKILIDIFSNGTSVKRYNARK